MTPLEAAASEYAVALEEAGKVKRQLMSARVRLTELDAELSEMIAEAKDDSGKASYSNADARKAALLTHPDHKAAALEVHELELESAEAETRVEIARIRWQTHRLLFAAEKGVMSL